VSVYKTRDYIHVMDLAEKHLVVLKNIDKFKADAVNLGTRKFML
jgi:UDP-glucose 4-epimerase